MQLRKVLCTLSLFAGLVATAYAADMIDNPEYKNWSACKAGSWVKFESTTNGMKSSYTNKLLEISADKAVVEMSMPPTKVGDKEYPIPPTKRDIAAKVEKPKDEGKGGDKPKEGDESVKVGGKDLKCHFYEAGGAKTYFSDEIPGRMAKMVSSTTTMEAVAWEKK
jgi:hypothetical protein